MDATDDPRPTGTQKATRDPDYFFDDGDIFVRVGDVVFKVRGRFYAEFAHADTRAYVPLRFIDIS